ncbi:MAG: riboflavin synthase [Candidatus Accumulibacter sp.]|jgi:riboflavin synthase|nr:riboflavin synthase [Accumulibacter sp.]
MFSGIVAALGRVTAVTPRENGARLTVEPGNLDLTDVAVGDSIAHAGVCLTVVERGEGWYCVDVSRETFACTTGLDAPGEVNLEKALCLNDRLGGHLVSGHVDGVGEVLVSDPLGDNRLLKIRAPHAISKFIARKGSVAVDGCSLTTNTVEGDDFTINLIPYTLNVTTLKHLQSGSRVNLEVDLIARYTERMLAWETEPDSASG